MWVKIKYKSWKNNIVEHTTYMTNKRQLKELFERYEIRPTDLLSFVTDEKDYPVSEVWEWVLSIR